jgi:hypothetical protein
VLDPRDPERIARVLQAELPVDHARHVGEASCGLFVGACWAGATDLRNQPRARTRIDADRIRVRHDRHARNRHRRHRLAGQRHQGRDRRPGDDLAVGQRARAKGRLPVPETETVNRK